MVRFASYAEGSARLSERRRRVLTAAPVLAFAGAGALGDRAADKLDPTAPVEPSFEA